MSKRIPDTAVIEGDIQNEWWYGPTGTGKSKLAWEKYGLICFQKMLNKWWDGYDAHPVVIIEEWSPKNEVTASALKIWADRYPFTAQIKGGVLQKIRPKKIIVLSNYRLSDCFPDNRDLEPLQRRFKEIKFPEGAMQAGFRAQGLLDSLKPQESDSMEIDDATVDSSEDLQSTILGDLGGYQSDLEDIPVQRQWNWTGETPDIDAPDWLFEA